MKTLEEIKNENHEINRVQNNNNKQKFLEYKDKYNIEKNNVIKLETELQNFKKLLSNKQINIQEYKQMNVNVKIKLD